MHILRKATTIQLAAKVHAQFGITGHACIEKIALLQSGLNDLQGSL